MLRRSVLVRTASLSCALAVWLFFTWRAMIVFAPATDVNDVSFNSDAAIPVLMSNQDSPLTPFNLYYYGADRWGGWPFLVTHTIGQVTGYRWTDDSLFKVQALWVLAGALAFAALAGRQRLLAGAIYLAVLCLYREGRYLMFELSQVYAWQMTGVLLAWLAIRRLHEAGARGDGVFALASADSVSSLDASGASGAGAADVRAGEVLAVDTRTVDVHTVDLRTVDVRAGSGQSTGASSGPGVRSRAATLWMIAAFICAYLAIWSSIASLVFLLFLVLVEAFRAWFSGAVARDGWRGLTPSVWSFGIVLLAAGLEHLQKLVYRAYAWAHFRNDFATRFEIDWEHLAENLQAQVIHLARLTWWPLYLLPLLMFAVFAVLLVWGRFRPRIMSSPDGVQPAVPRASSAPADTEQTADALDLGVLALGAYGIALINIALAVAISHVRLNGYDSRYLTLTTLFGPMAGLLVACLLLRLTIASARQWTQARAALVAAAVALLLWAFPTGRPSVYYQGMKQTALVLSQRAPGELLLGTYWDTYVFAALQSSHANVPVPFEGPYNVTPWTIPLVRRASRVIVAFPRLDAKAAMPMPEQLRQYGVRFRLVDGTWYSNSLYQFALYEHERR